MSSAGLSQGIDRHHRLMAPARHSWFNGAACPLSRGTDASRRAMVHANGRIATPAVGLGTNW